MRKLLPIFVCLLIVPLLLFAQKPSPRGESLLVPNEQRVSGVVTDSKGQPIGGAQIWHTTERIKEIVTNLNGHFDFSTRAPAFVIRKAGFESAFVRSENAQDIRITLQQSSGAIPVCSTKSSCTLIDGWGCLFCLPNVRGVRISDQINDIDYGSRDFTVRSRHGRQGVRHGGGPLWGAGFPFDEDVWASIEYTERTYIFGKTSIIDAKGKTKSGKFWRSIGRFGETAYYDDVDQESAAVLDKLLDGVCILQESENRYRAK